MRAALALWLAVAAAGPVPPASGALYRVLWAKPLVPPGFLEWKPREAGGPAVDAATGLVVVGTRDAYLRALHPDGSLLWEFKAGAGFEAPALVEGDTVYAGSLDGRLYALEKATGKERWRYDAREELGSRPVAAGGLVYVTTLQDTLLALDAKTGAWKWNQRRENAGRFTIRGAGGPAVANGTVYAGFSDGVVAAFDAASGTARWERPVAPKGDFMDVDSTPLLEGTRVYVAAYSGVVTALEAATGKTIWEARVPGASRLVLTGGRLVAVGAASVLALSPKSGKVLWTTPLEGVPAGDPVATPVALLVPNTAGLLLLEPGWGRRLRTFTRGKGISASPALLGRTLYLLTDGGELVALELGAR